MTKVNASLKQLTERKFWQSHVRFPFRFKPQRGVRGICLNRWTSWDFSPNRPDPACEVSANYPKRPCAASPKGPKADDPPISLRRDPLEVRYPLEHTPVACF
ncbi:hypothetical protein thalar_01684 [Litoreibacter arenae DSM 19593]|uniref:Uncharacterized protein n=1 Tax=Litoreibacter arenae DSM 19593 TaxID=1123360 RepID=S9S2A3_9RHOB|nr:hypothetical protein thalar_01684 [Litoreibacter arenae DSM 19593]